MKRFIKELKIACSLFFVLAVCTYSSAYPASIRAEKMAVPKATSQENKIVVKGTVTDPKGEPLIGVSILEKGTNNGTITDAGGNFSLQTTTGTELEFSYVGYATQTVQASPGQMKVVMKEDTEILNEVVVTALGIKREAKALSYNVQQVKGDELTSVRDANFINSLSGKVAGVTINASSSGMGGATRVVMRGVKSIASNNNALYVIDGVPIFNTNNGATKGTFSAQPQGEGISDLNPDDIESMSVLSGPAAAALYGSSAASGVILITTKKGKEGKARVTISNSTTFSRPFLMPKFQNAYGNEPNSFMSWGEKGATTGYNPAGFFNTGTNVQNTVSLSLGSGKSQTYLSLGTTNAKGIIIGNKYERYNFNVRNTTSFLNGKMNLDLGFGYIIQDDANMVAQGQYFNPLPAVYLFPRGEDFEAVRMFEAYDQGRNLNVQNWPWGDQGMQMQNPFWIAKRMNHGTKKQRYMMNAGLKYQILDWMNAAGRVRIDNAVSDYEEKRYASTNELFASKTGFYHLNRMYDRQAYADFMININKNLNDFSLAANIGTSFTQTYNNNAGYQGALKDLPNVFNYYNIDKNGRDTYPIFSSQKHRIGSVFANAELGWKSMIYLTLTGRNDWDSSLENMPQNSFFYPSAGLSGVISQMVDLPEAISYMKLRASFASVGSGLEPGLTSAYAYKWEPSTGKWTTKSYKPLSQLYPEKTNSWEAGLNAKFFGNTVSLDVTWYRSDTKNQTITVPLSASSTYTQMYVQSGNVNNWGMEFALGYNKDWGDFGWNSNLTFSFNKNKITSLLHDYVDEDGTHYTMDEVRKGDFNGAQYILRPGGTMGDLYVTRELKRDQEGNIWIDPNTKNVVSEDLKNNPKKVGSVLPSSNMGFRNDFSWKGFNLGVMVAARFGGVVISQTEAILDQYGVSENSARCREQGGIPINNGIVDTRKFFSVVGGSNGTFSHYVYSATNVRLQELSIGYTFPRKWLANKMGLNLSLVARNLWMIYNKAPFDPESTASTDTYNQGIDYFMQPSLRNIGFSVKVQF